MKINQALWLPIISAAVAVLALAPASCTDLNSSRAFEQILSVIPDTPDTRSWVAINDYAKMQKEFQINAPPVDATGEEQKNYLFELLKLSSGADHFDLAASLGFINDTQYFDFSLEAMHNIGLGYWSIDQEAETGRPPGVLKILKGRFDTDKITQALNISAKDNPPLIEEYHKNTIFSWGGDNEIDLTKRFMPPVYDFLGRGGRFIFQDNYAFRTNQTPGIKLAVDTQQGRYTSLYEVPEFKLMARELSSQGAMAAILTNRSQSVEGISTSVVASDQYDSQDVREVLSQEPKLIPYQAMALGMAKDENGLLALIILVHADEQSAAKNVPLLHRRIEETTRLNGDPWTSSISSSSVTNRGRTLIAKLHGPIGKAWIRWYYMLDPLLLSKES